MPPSPLFARIAQEIRADGPMGLDRYMALCLGHPEHGYYRTRDPLGRAGDFTTAPEISQMFGELVGVWIAAAWQLMGQAMGAPARVNLVELGPGRGTLMADALRALRVAAPGADACLHLVETSPALRRIQAGRLAEAAPTWHEDLGTLPAGPLIVVANEFFDALPARQFERARGGWHERRIGLTPDGGRLAWGLAPEPTPGLASRPADPGAVLTVPGPALEAVRVLSRRLARDGGALLAIDYGHDRPGLGDTLQAVRGHRFADPLEAPGEADLTVHVDFPALARAATGEGARVHGPVSQRRFLLDLGLRTRADRLKAGTPAAAEAIEAGFARLTDPAPRGMGALFKVLGLSGPGLAALPALPPA